MDRSTCTIHLKYGFLLRSLLTTSFRDRPRICRLARRLIWLHGLHVVDIPPTPGSIDAAKALQLEGLRSLPLLVAELLRATDGAPDWVDAALAFAMGAHIRLGGSSPIGALNEELVAMIGVYFVEDV